DIFVRIRKTKARLAEVKTAMEGNESISKRNANQPPSITERLTYILWATWETTSDVTKTQSDAFSIAAGEFSDRLNELKSLVETDLHGIEQDLENADAPYTPGRLPEWQPE
ncbi:MAG: hypothetical protein KDC45_09750, partial [Bacteroidetes bacterium]|nr:hypothetical protein [Bacteroidota bacterium]